MFQESLGIQLEASEWSRVALGGSKGAPVVPGMSFRLRSRVRGFRVGLGPMGPGPLRLLGWAQGPVPKIRNMRSRIRAKVRGNKSSRSILESPEVS